MENLAKAIKEAAEYLDCGFGCSIHKENYDVIQVFDADVYDQEEHPYLFEEQKLVDANPEQYHHVEKMPTHMAFQIMEDFVDSQVANQRQSEALYESLSGKQPFRRFKETLLRHGIEQSWYDYKQGRYEEYVREAIF